MTQHNNSKQAIRLPLYLALAAVLGIFLGSQLTDGGTGSSLGGEVSKFRQVMTYIQNDYVDEVSGDELVEKSIESLLKELDPHSAYFPAEDQEIIGSQLEANFEGIGVEFNVFRDTVVVLSALSGGPSEKVGIQNGDKILKADDKELTGSLSNMDVVRTLRGPKGTPVELTILRNGRTLSFTVVRDEIPQFSVDAAYMITPQVGYIKISRFAATTYQEFLEAFDKLEKLGMEKLMLDLTGNLGGYMDQALLMLDEFIVQNKLLLYTKGKESRYNETHRSERKGVYEEGDLVVLIDEGSASAAEIVAGAVQDHDRGWIVGRRSFGKGLVQRTVNFKDGSAMRLTISRYYIPSGRSIQKPYELGELDNYYQEAFQRYESGEMYSLDSIELNDTLAYETSGGRKVYGGGGILPDYYVPLDSGGSTARINRMIRMGILNSFGFDYAQREKSALENMGLEAFMNDFGLTDQIIKQLVNQSVREGVEITQRELSAHAKLVERYVKAFIARSVWNQDGFYQFWNREDEIVQQGLRVITSPRTFTAQAEGVETE